jgi:hypothetical protein
LNQLGGLCRFPGLGDAAGAEEPQAVQRLRHISDRLEGGYPMKHRTRLLAIATTLTFTWALAPMAHAAGAFSVSRQTAAKWMQGYLNAWETRDADAVVKLFTPTGVYQSIPGVSNQTFVGRKAIHKYWFDVTRPQSMIHGIQGTPIVSGNRAAIEIWVTFRDPVYNPKGDHMITLLETNVVTFVKGGLASKNVEYWNIITGVHSPPAGWGS